MKKQAFNEFFEDVTRTARKIPKMDYQEQGKYPIIDQGQEFCSGYTDEEDGLFTDVPAFIFGDHTRIIKYVDKPFFLGADGVKLLQLRDKEHNIPKYFYYALLQQDIPDTGYNRHFKWLKETFYDVPAMGIQQRRTEILSKLDAVLEKRQKQLALLDTMVQSRFIELFGDPVTNPKGWPVQKLVEICEKVTDGTHFSPESYETGPYKYVTAKNIKLGGFDFSNISYVPEEVHKEIYSRCNPEYGDVLYIKDGATTGIAMVNSLKEEFSLLSSVALIKPKSNELNGHFLCGVLNNEHMYQHIRAMMGGAAITRLTVAKIKPFKILVPPISLQNQFADFIVQVDKSKAVLQRSIRALTTLKASLSQTWFGPGAADPFYAPENISYLKKVVTDVKNGTAKFAEHDLIGDE